MDNKLFPKKLNEILTKCNAFIVYTPLSKDIDHTTIPFAGNISRKLFYLPSDKNSDPYAWVNNCQNHCKESSVCILIPGRRFDIYGTRHGHGGGWYDRFLEKAPKNWIRIGIASQSNFSSSALLRKPWDEPMDWIIVQENFSWQVYDTQARIPQ